ncbi:MAG: DPP IV N-terminal domain-containing protein [Planctomycetes bacterium]|nr:DPP IV N-terminal domain-containing protein [Planctomycetota bacterium]MCB9891862.1 DPP IV N-terminal domain-containing protein [Planctomycetota bacterium]MCB9918718.1 DPP IV N-terminal domain-containing protein [Planctomycetota bacterium]
MMISLMLSRVSALVLLIVSTTGSVPRAQTPATAPRPISFERAQGAPITSLDLPDARWSHDGTRVLLGRGATATSVDPESGEARASTAEEREEPARTNAAPQPRRRRAGRDRLTLASGEARLVTKSPDERHATFVRGHDLWIYDFETKEERRLTTNGSDDLYHGELDWVYQEEIYGRGTFRAQWFSPDSKKVAFLSLVTKNVPSYPLVDVLPTVPKRQELRYPKVGQPNPEVSLTIADVATGAMTRVDLDRFPKDRLIVRVGWTPDSRDCLFAVQDRIQTWYELCALDTKSGDERSLLREVETAGWTDRLPLPVWLADGSFLWTSHRSGFRKLYRYDRNAELISELWKDDFGIASIVRIDDRGLVDSKEPAEIWLTGYADNSVDLHAWRVALDGKSVQRVTEAAGMHKVTPSPGGHFVLDAWSSLENPGKLEVRDRDGRLVRVLADAKVVSRDNLLSGTWRTLRIPARDGYVLDAAILTSGPARSDARRPIWIDTYSGPHAPSVRNAWNGRAWFHFLANKGMIVLQVNVRSAEPLARMKSVHACYRDFGARELQDLEDAVAYVCANESGDPARVGITGWSYGGTMTAYALTHSKAFRLGVAGAGVYDWRLYDTIYTERYMSTDEGNPEGYAHSSVVAAAPDLHGHLVLYHGTEDDNVHFQNCMQLVYALQQAGKDFELMIFPNATHGGGNGRQAAQRARMTWRAIEHHLLDPSRRLDQAKQEDNRDR